MLNIALDNVIFYLLHVNTFRYFSNFHKINQVPIEKIMQKIQTYVQKLPRNGIIRQTLLDDYDIISDEFLLTGGLENNFREIFLLKQNSTIEFIEEKKREFAAYKRRPKRPRVSDSNSIALNISRPPVGAPVSRRSIRHSNIGLPNLNNVVR